MALFGTESMIGSDVLDIGSRNARRQRGVGEMNSLGNPGQFDLPNVQDVSSIGLFWIELCYVMCDNVNASLCRRKPIVY